MRERLVVLAVLGAALGLLVPPAGAAPTRGLPKAGACVQGKAVSFRVRAPQRVRVVRVKVAGKPVRRVRGRGLRRVVRVRLTGARTRLRVVVVRRDGRRAVVRRSYRRCATPRADLGTRPVGGGPVRVPGCTDDSRHPGGVHPGGDWPINGHDFSNSRTQDRETRIGVDQARALGPAWTFSSKVAGGAGDFTGTPLVRDGCVFAATTRGWIFAMNADTGRLVWKTKLSRGGRVYQSVSVGYGKVFAGVTAATATDACTDECVQPYFVALDQRTGKEVWTSPGLEDAQGADILGAPLVFDASDNGRDDPVVFTGISAFGAEGDFGDGAIRYANDGSFVLMDATSGAVLEHTYVVAKDPKDAHAGCGIWSSPAIDFTAGLGYVGVSNPHNPANEHPNCNSVIEFQADRTKPNFGSIVRNFKGTPDDYVREFVPGFPCVAIPGIPRPTPSQEVGTCTDMDLAVGAPPNLIDLPDGRRLLGVGQKSGHYHLWDRASGAKLWRAFVGIPTIIGGVVGATAFDGEKIYGPSTVPGFVFALDLAGASTWNAPHSVVSYGNPTTTANGVVYTTTQRNTLNAYAADTGAELYRYTLPPGPNEQGTVGGVAVARNTVYAAVGTQTSPEGFIVAFRPGAKGGTSPGGGEGGEPPEEPPGESGGSPGATIVAGPGATSTGFPAAAMPKGASLSFLNLDSQGHDVVARDKGLDGQPLFRSDIGALGSPTPVVGAEKLAGGKTYSFFCSVHPSMTGTLLVGP